jgi:hypothetical protein
MTIADEGTHMHGLVDRSKEERTKEGCGIMLVWINGL